MPLPAGLTTRPLALSDAASVAAVMAAEETLTLGAPQIDEADIVSDWQRPSFDLAASSLGVFDGPDLIGCAEVSGVDRGDAAVSPDHHGRGIGTHLARWMQARAHDAGSARIGMPVPVGSPGDHLLTALGYQVRWTSWILELFPGMTIPPRALPDGYAVRTARTAEHRDAWRLLDDAFLEWSDREPEPFDDFAAKVVDRPGYEPWHLRVVLDPGGTVVGVAQLALVGEVAFVDRLAVHRDQRGLGLAQVLLSDSFTVAREHGASHCQLSTDSRTGALGLYEKVGMVVTSTWVHRAIGVTGDDARTNAT